MSRPSPDFMGHSMRRFMLAAISTACAMAGFGCAGRPLVDNPAFIKHDPSIQVANPVFLTLGPPDYAVVFERTLDVLDDYFEIERADRYAGLIVTRPKIAPGLEQPWKPGSPDTAERFLATLQTIRYRCEVTIRPDQGGYFVKVIVFKELEDLPRPLRQLAGDAAFRSDPSRDRQFDVVTPDVVDTRWIPLGQEPTLEQAILQRITTKLSDRAKSCSP
ncbi:MAG: hypothetical protein U0746_12675 [Gemmataceae bacterium]